MNNFARFKNFDKMAYEIVDYYQASHILCITGSKEAEQRITFARDCFADLRKLLQKQYFSMKTPVLFSDNLVRLKLHSHGIHSNKAALNI